MTASLPTAFVAAVCAEAAAWEGTPFVWQQSAKGHGCDCKGFIWGVARELGLPEAQSSYALMADYQHQIPLALLREGLTAIFDPVPGAPEPGDVLLLKINGAAQHMAIVTAPNRAMHAQIAPADRVKTASLAALLRRFDLDSVWRWRVDEVPAC